MFRLKSPSRAVGFGKRETGRNMITVESIASDTGGQENKTCDVQPARTTVAQYLVRSW
jgi:hypothetical protein